MRELESAKEKLEEAFKGLLYLGLSFMDAKKIALRIIDSRMPEVCCGDAKTDIERGDFDDQNQ